MSTTKSVIANWVEQHPYLDEIASFQKILATAWEESFEEVEKSETFITDWENIEKELKRGIPALRAGAVNDQLIAQTKIVVIKMLDLLVNADIPVEMKRQCQMMQDHVKADEALLSEYIEQVASGEEFTVADEDQVLHGVIVFLIWSALDYVLQPLKVQVKESQAEVKWHHEYCPVCGQLPAMAQLVKTKKGRERELVCGCCKTPWRYKRIECPFCKNDNQKTLNLIEMDGVTDFRIDTCDKCKGYLKTYTDEGDEQLLLSDWSTLHLDMIAKEKGFKRIGYQLYKI